MFLHVTWGDGAHASSSALPHSLSACKVSFRFAGRAFGPTSFLALKTQWGGRETRTPQKSLQQVREKLGNMEGFGCPSGAARRQRGELSAFRGIGACVNRIQAPRSFKSFWEFCPPVLWMIKQHRLNLDLQDGTFDASCPHAMKEQRSLKEQL